MSATSEKSEANARRPSFWEILYNPKGFLPLLGLSGAVLLISTVWAFGVESYLADGEDVRAHPKQVLSLAGFASAVIMWSLRSQLKIWVRMPSVLPVITPPAPESTSNATPAKPKPFILNVTPLSEAAPTPYKWTPSFASSASRTGAVLASPSTATKPASSSAAVTTMVTSTPTPRPPAGTPAKTPVTALVSTATPLSGKKTSDADPVFQSAESPVVLRQARVDTPQSQRQAIQDQQNRPAIDFNSATKGLQQRLMVASQQQVIPQPQAISFGTSLPAEGIADVPVSDENVAYQIMMEVGGEDKMERRVENLRRALRTYITAEILDPLDAVNRELSPFIPEAMLTWAEEVRGRDGEEEDLATTFATRSLDSSRMPPQSLLEIQIRLKRRKDLERFFIVKRGAKDAFPKKYVLKRLRKLAASEDLAEFRWCGGEDIDGVKWSADHLPTDAEILFRVFTVYMDVMLHETVSFTTKYVEDAGSGTDLDALKAKEWTGFLVCGRTISPGARTTATSSLLGGMGGLDMGLGADPQHTFWPHYKLMIEGQLLEVKARRLNLYHSIILFLYKYFIVGPSKPWMRPRVQDLLTLVFGDESRMRA